MELVTDTIEEMTCMFKVLSDPTRLRLAVLLSIRGESCVCNLAQALDEPEYKTSRHLIIMKAAGMVRARREGTWIHYRMAKPDSPLAVCLQSCLRSKLLDQPEIQEILARTGTITCK